MKSPVTEHHAFGWAPQRPSETGPEACAAGSNAKYDRNDTQYQFDTGLDDQTCRTIQDHAVTVYRAMGCRHLSRVDFIVDERHQPWFLEINTIPGFTDHSLLPMAAAKAGLDMPALCDKLVRMAMAEDGVLT